MPTAEMRVQRHRLCAIRLALTVFVVFSGGPIAVTGEPPSVRTDVYGDPLPPGVLARIGSSRLRHNATAPVSWVGFTPDGNMVISEAGGQFRFWDARTEKLIGEINARLAEGPDAVSPDGKLLAVGALDKIVLFDIASRTKTREIPIAPAAYKSAIDFSADGSRIVCKIADRGVQVFELSSGRELQRHRTGAMCYCRATDMLAIADPKLEGKIDIVRAADGKAVRQLNRPGFYFRPVSFSRDGKLLAIRQVASSKLERGDDAASDVVVVNVGDGVEVRRFSSDGLRGVNESFGPDIFSPDGSLIGVQFRGTGRVYKIADGNEVARLRHHPAFFSPDGRTLACLDDQHVELIDVATWKSRDDPFPDSPGFVAVLADQTRIATLAAQGDGVLLWDASTGKLSEKIPLPDAKSLRYSARTNVLAVASPGRVTIWDVSRRAAVREIKLGPTDDLFDFVLSDDGRTLAVAEKEAAVVYSVASGAEIARLPALPGWGGDLVLAPDGTWSRVPRTRWPAPAGNNLALSPDGTLLAAAQWCNSDPQAMDPSYRTAVWHVPTQELVLRTNTDRAMEFPLRFMRSGHLLMTGGNVDDHKGALDTIVAVYEPATGVAAARFVEAAAEALPGERLANGHAPGVRRPRGWEIWDLVTGKVVREIDDYPPAQTIARLSDPRKCVLRGYDGTILIWQAPSSWVPRVQKAQFSGDLGALWDRLAGDSRGAYQASATLADAGDQAEEFFASHWTSPSFDSDRARAWITDLSSDDVDVRSRARDGLKRLGPQAVPLMNESLDHQLGDAASKKDLRNLIALVCGPLIEDSEELRRVRAIQVLEMIGTRKARELLARISKGPPAARETRYASEALARLESKE